MLPKNTERWKCCFIYYILCVVYPILWDVAASYVIKFEEILQCFAPCVLISIWVRFFILSFKKWGRRIFSNCRAPPSGLDFAIYQPEKSRLEDYLMKEINLRDYYPFYTRDKIVEVPDEVADLLREYALLEEAYRIRTYRHKAYYSLDYDKNVERDILYVQPTLFEILEGHRMTELVYKGLAALPEKQKQRIYAHYFLGMSIAEIARKEKCAFMSVKESIERGLRRLEKILEKDL